MRQLSDIALSDETAERVRRDHAEAIRELQRMLPAIVKGVSLVDGVATHVAHPLGVAPQAVVITAVRGAIATAGRIVETTDNVDRSKLLKLTATGWGATITVDVLVFR